MRKDGASQAMGATMTRRRCCAWALALPLVACGTKPPKPATVAGSLQAAAGLNPSVTQRPSPLRVRVYELKSATTFNGADFMALYQQDQAALGADLLAREEFVLQPGESRPYNKALAPDTRFIGVVALYRDLERAVWRTVVPIQPSREHKLTIRADALAVSVTQP